MGTDDRRFDPASTAAMNSADAVDSAVPRPSPQADRRASRVALHPDHEVLVAKVLVHTLVASRSLEEVQQEIVARIGDAHEALVVDCSSLDRTSAEFLGNLVKLRRMCAERRLGFGVCGLHGALGEAFIASELSKFVSAYPTPREAVLALGEFSDWERATIEAATRQDDSAGEGTAAREAWKAAGAWRTAAVAAVAILLASTLLWRAFFSASTSERERKDAVWRTAAPAVIEGRVERRGATAEAGAVVVAWPADIAWQEPSELARDDLFAADGPPRLLSLTGPFLARSDEQGRFFVQVRTPQGSEADYHLLVLSASLAPEGRLSEDDRALIGRYFADPARLIGLGRYRLERCRVVAGVPSLVECRLD